MRHGERAWVGDGDESGVKGEEKGGWGREERRRMEGRVRMADFVSQTVRLVPSMAMKPLGTM
jgi:hypothetical protein